MNLIAHIVRKDLRRLAAPLGIWLAVVLGKAAALVVYARGSAPWPGEWLGPAVACVNGLELMLGYLIAVLLVLEDSPADKRALWKTRPVSGGTLLAAKLCGGAAAFVVTPVLLLIPVWLAAGFGSGELGLAALDWVCIRGTLTLAAVATAAVSGGLGQSVFYPATLAPLAGLGAAMDWTLPGGRAGALVLTAGAAGLALVLQYGARRRLAAALVLALGAGIAAGGSVGGWRPLEKTDAEAWLANEDGRSVKPGSVQAASGGQCRVFAVTAGRVTRHTEQGYTREVVRPARIELRSTSLDPTLLSKAARPEPLFRWRSPAGDAEKAQASRRGQARAASIRVVDFAIELTPGVEERATWHDWLPRANATPNK